VPSTVSEPSDSTVREPPEEARDADVLAEVRRARDADVDRVSHQALGFGAHHWAAYAAEVTAGRRQQLVAGVRPHGANRP